MRKRFSHSDSQNVDNYEEIEHRERMKEKTKLILKTE